MMAAGECAGGGGKEVASQEPVDVGALGTVDKGSRRLLVKVTGMASTAPWGRYWRAKADRRASRRAEPERERASTRSRCSRCRVSDGWGRQVLASMGGEVRRSAGVGRAAAFAVEGSGGDLG
ncbi:hypothetical protein Sros01_73680 [Streptomyces roseochromogenus]|nr:hypothetical protein Sros01_73680 [Streptomyces roseochromogenus]